ncbi:MAG TPA: alkyl hydroperoxide reductase [Micromonosporaceae bacterium]|nr:alkyl hydroperoxide reductase [Micromonosporaceae bacterium]HCU50525.1 alkyl hydroperoxide reductase [Micromonosporaceae bacterium]
MSLDALKQAMPEYAKDIKLNLGTVLGASKLPAQQLWGTALAAAIATRGQAVLREIDAAARVHLSPDAYEAARAAAAVMAMNNIYYRGIHLMDDPAYADLPARLRMQVIGNPGVDPADFEFWCLAVSAVNGCGRCLTSHERVLRDKGVTKEVIQEAIRIAAVVHAAAVTLETDTWMSDTALRGP